MFHITGLPEEIANRRDLVLDMRNAAGPAAWTPLDIPGCVLWLDASQIVGLADGDPVTTWPDLSGGGYDAIQVAPALKPIYRTGIQNGLPVVRFDGLNDILTVAGLGAAFAGITEGTLFASFGPNDLGDYNVCEFTGSLSMGYWRWNGDGNGYIAELRAARLNALPLAQPTAGWHIHTIRSGPINGYNYRRDGSLDVAVAANWGISADCTIGERADAANSFTGDMGELVLYAAELSDPDVVAVDTTYLWDKWIP